jgi:hypothetical protein
VGNFIMKETDNAMQRQGWVLRMDFDRQGASAFETHVARLDARGIPRPDPNTPSPCWRRGQAEVATCLAGRPR